MPQVSKIIVGLYAFAYVVGSVSADSYLQSPRGSNNRACRNDNNTNRRNGNRLFDSQNNDKGGYSCPRAYPFACYDPEINGQNCNNNQNGQAQSDGTLTSNSAYLTNTAKQYYFEGSVLPIEWTNQHGCGTNTKLHCEMVVQFACEDSLSEDGNQPRDGTPITNNDGNNRDDEASDTIPTNNNQQDDYRYGRHETNTYYNLCEDTERNAGLLTLDQNLNGNDARYTRQNPNGNRNGLECPEESEYYPYWRPSPWKDLAIMSDDMARCQQLAAASENVVGRGLCQNYNGGGKIPITQAACTAGGGQWTTTAPHGLAAPQCMLGPWTRDNHLGNAGVGVVPGQQAGLNVTVPAAMANKANCILRVRYNMSTSDSANGIPGTNDAAVKEVTVNGDKTDNDAIYDRNNNEVKSYINVLGDEIGTAVNTNQFGRTFQDRTHTFAVKPAPTAGNCAGKAIHNLNVRGKRGNIVQTYPSVEYDFVPNVLTVETEDCVHVAFFGSDYNPNRNPNNGEGGPPNPNNDDEAKADRTNMVAMEFERSNFPLRDGQSTAYVQAAAKIFNEDTQQFRRLAFLDQQIVAGGAGSNGNCENINSLRNIIGGNGAGDREARERDSRNCAKLSGQKTPAFDGGLLRAGATGDYAYMSTRNNNLTNRGQKAVITVAAVGAIGSGPGKLPNNANNNFGSAGAAAQQQAALASNLGIAGGVAGGLVALGAAFVAYRRMSNSSASAGAMSPMAGGGSVVTARYAHNAKEAGELSFQKGEQITVTRQDASGWWEGQSASGARGVFPSNYVQ